MPAIEKMVPKKLHGSSGAHLAARLPFVRAFQHKVPPLHGLVPGNQKEMARSG
jgi:hypothetical protein